MVIVSAENRDLYLDNIIMIGKVIMFYFPNLMISMFPFCSIFLPDDSRDNNKKQLKYYHHKKDLGYGGYLWFIFKKENNILSSFY